MKIGIFLEPKSNIKRSITYWKNQFKKKYKNATYLHHPIHLTVFTLDVNSSFLKDIKSSKINLNLIKNKKLNLKILSSDCFYSDPISNNNTLHFKVKKNKNLNDFQIRMINFLKDYRIFKNKKYDFQNLKLNSNMKKYGYPFLHNNWLPHFTICSINKKNLNDELSKKFLKSKLSSKIIISKYSLWLIENEKHTKLKDYIL
jgi:2'-5' RNA ligase